MLKRLFFKRINPNKVNQVIHVEYLKNVDNIKKIMAQHAAILRPKFDLFKDRMEEAFAGDENVSWSKPRGGYFISLNVEKGCAKRTEELCANAGLILTPAGAAFPYGIDPDDSNLRIAPSYPSAKEIEIAAEVLCTAVRYAVLEKLLKEN